MFTEDTAFMDKYNWVLFILYEKGFAKLFETFDVMYYPMLRSTASDEVENLDFGKLELNFYILSWSWP